MDGHREKDWFEVWFNSPYYSILYKNRDGREAQAFIDELLQILDPVPGTKVLDLACGRGRYSSYLSNKGFNVTGIDISPTNIEYAKKKYGGRITFFRHDMRKPLPEDPFHYIFNFFTSFGYFENESQHMKVLQHVSEALKKNGIFVLDYFNARHVREHLKAKESKVIDGIRFDLERRIDEQFVEKDIRFIDQQRIFHFRERVKLFSLKEFEELFSKAGLSIFGCYGDYQLSPFSLDESRRLILMARKTS